MTARDYIDFSLLQLDRLLEAAMPHASGLPRTESFVDPDTGEVSEQTVQDAPNWQAARLAVDLIKARLKILGLGAPQKIHIDAETAVAPELLAGKVAELRRNARGPLPDDVMPEGDS
jgi:hypothetical protein